jgi:hypothetical protein
MVTLVTMQTGHIAGCGKDATASLHPHNIKSGLKALSSPILGLPHPHAARRAVFPRMNPNGFARQVTITRWS